jgi:FAD:protein FMN transferase
MNQETQIHLSLYAMATRFELLMFGGSEIHLRAAGEEALQEIERLEAQLSFYRRDSEINFLNRQAAEGFIKVEPRLFTLLKRCVSLSELTEGAFDITIAPLMRAWHFVHEKGGIPEHRNLQKALAKTGIELLEFDEEALAIRFRRAGVEVDLGGFGKGYAVQRAMDLLREHGVKSALLHGGTSSVATIGSPPKQSAWRIKLPEPFTEKGKPMVIGLMDQCLSVSAIHGKSFMVEGRQYGHIINPLTGAPADTFPAAAVRGTDAAVCEAFSKALLIHSSAWWQKISESFPAYEPFIAAPAKHARGS